MQNFLVLLQVIRYKDKHMKWSKWISRIVGLKVLFLKCLFLHDYIAVGK